MDKIQIPCESKTKKDFKAITAIQGKEMSEVIREFVKGYCAKYKNLLAS